MSSDTYYRLEIEGLGRNGAVEKSYALLKELHEIDPETRNCLGPALCSDDWCPHDYYDNCLKTALLRLSERHPALMFVLMIEGEAGEMWKFEAKDGKGTDYDSEVAYVNPRPYQPVPQEQEDDGPSP